MTNPFIQRATYQSPPSPARPPSVNPTKLSQAIKMNETGGVNNPYSFRRPSGAGDYANGAYQIRDSELQTYAPRYLGRPVTSEQFLADPTLQDNYMNVKATALAGRGLTAEQILAAHRGGASDLTPQALQALQTKYQPYVSKGMQFYNTNQPPVTANRSFADLSK